MRIWMCIENLKKTIISLLVLVLFFSSAAEATPDTLNFQARIRKNGGAVLEDSDVSFFFRYTSADGACVLYEEAYDHQNMSGSGGLVNFQLGVNVDNPTFQYRRVFSSAATDPTPLLIPHISRSFTSQVQSV